MRIYIEPRLGKQKPVKGNNEPLRRMNEPLRRMNEPLRRMYEPLCGIMQPVRGISEAIWGKKYGERGVQISPLIDRTSLKAVVIKQDNYAKTMNAVNTYDLDLSLTECCDDSHRIL